MDMDEALITQILEELISVDKRHSEGKLDEKEYVKAKADLFHKYMNNRIELCEALVKSPYCFSTYFRNYFKKEGKEVKFVEGCTTSQLGCDECCRNFMYDSVLSHINRIRIE